MKSIFMLEKQHVSHGPGALSTPVKMQYSTTCALFVSLREKKSPVDVV